MIKPELLAPAGNLEKLKIAFAYGADAVYLGGEQFSLRQGAGNFTKEEMKEGLAHARKLNKKVYVALNVFSHNDDIKNLPPYLQDLSNLEVDGVIVSDPGIIAMIKKLAPGLNIHLSTQANTTNWASVDFWQNQGIKRVVLARELSLKEIKEIKDKTSVELEAFIHGAMCVAYSGRCLLSSYWTGRSANRGACTHPCRWRYTLMEETRPGEYLPVEEDERGSYILSSRDLSMVEHIPELIQAGLTSWKIEGRMKSVHYVATITKVYREAIDMYWANPQAYEFRQIWKEELEKVTDRGFTTGFYFTHQQNEEMMEKTKKRSLDAQFVGMVLARQANGLTLVEQRNRFARGDWLEVLPPVGDVFHLQLKELFNEEGEAIDAAPHPQQKVLLKIPQVLEPYTLLRRV